jgi:serine/threonine-protein kinase HipA
MPNSIRDAAPDAWGRRVIINRKLGTRGSAIDTGELNEIAYLLESGSDRAGALDFQRSATNYVARESVSAALSELLDAADSVERGVPLSEELDAALLHGSSIGGARPKAMITAQDRKFVAKFSSQNDLYSVVKAEFIAMRLAAEVGLDVAPVELHEVAGKDVLLIERFDRKKEGDGWLRRGFVSALTLLELDEMMARYASYQDLATIVRHRFVAPKETLKELFARMLFNVLCGNTDDHARNHAAFWDGRSLALTPAYDVCPQARSGNEATQAMLISGEERMSRIDVCLRAAPSFLLSRDQAIAIAKHQIEIIRDNWSAVCKEANLSEVDRNLFWLRQFLNPFAFEGAPGELAALLG